MSIITPYEPTKDVDKKEIQKTASPQFNQVIQSKDSQLTEHNAGGFLKILFSPSTYVPLFQKMASAGFEIPKGIARALATPVGFLQEASGREAAPIELPKFLETLTGEKQQLDYAPPKTLGEVGWRVLDTTMIPGVGTLPKAVIKKGAGVASKYLQSVSKTIPANAGIFSRTIKKVGDNLTPETKAFKTLLKDREVAYSYTENQWKREVNKFIKPLKKTNEVNNFLHILAGRAHPIKPSKELLDAVDWYADVALKQKKYAATRGVAQEALDERNFLELRKITGKSTKELKGSLGIKAEGAAKISDAIKNRKPFEPIYTKITMEDSPNLGQILFGKYFKRPGTTPSFLKKATGSGVLSEHRAMDAYSVIMKRGLEEIKDEVDNSFINRVIKEFGEEVLPGAKGIVPKGRELFSTQTKGFSLAKKGEKQYSIPEGLTRVFDEWTEGRAIQNEWLRLAGSSIDAINNVWKTTVLPLRPAWMAINTTGNATLNLVGGIKVLDYVRAVMPSYRKMISLAGKEKIGLKSSLGRAEFQGFGSKISRLLYKPNEYIEDYFRWTHFLSKGRKFAKQELKASGKSTSRESIINLIKESSNIQKKSVKEVNTYLFNYQGLSPLEKETIKRVVPFYNWTKNITRLAGQLVVEKPDTAARLFTFYNKLTSGTKDDENLPEYLRGAIKTDLAVNSDGNVVLGSDDAAAAPLYWNFRYHFPFWDVAGLSLGSLSPVFKIPLERMTGQQFYGGGFATPGRDFSAPSHLKKYEEVVEPPKGLGRIFKPQLEYSETKELQRAVPSYARHIGSQTSVFNIIDSLMNSYSKYSATGKPIETKYGEVKYPKDENLKILSYLLGISLSPYKDTK